MELHFRPIRTESAIGFCYDLAKKPSKLKILKLDFQLKSKGHLIPAAIDALGFCLSRYIKNLHNLTVSIEVSMALPEINIMQFTKNLERMKTEHQTVQHKTERYGYRFHWTVTRKHTDRHAYLRYTDRVC